MSWNFWNISEIFHEIFHNINFVTQYNCTTTVRFNVVPSLPCDFARYFYFFTGCLRNPWQTRNTGWKTNTMIRLLFCLQDTVKPQIEAGSRIEAGSQIQAGGFRSLVLIEAGSRIEVGSQIQAGVHLVVYQLTAYDAISDVIVSAISNQNGFRCQYR